MLLIVGKEIRRGICHTIHRYAKANSKQIKDYGKNKELSYFKYRDVNNLCRCPTSQNQVKNISKFDESFIKSYN